MWAALLVAGLAAAETAAPKRMVVGQGLPVRLSAKAVTKSELLKLELKGKDWFLTGLSPGVAELQIGKDAYEVEVQPLAAEFPQPPRIATFGEFSPEVAADQWARDYVAPGASYSVVNQTVSASGPGLFPVSLPFKKIQWDQVAWLPQPAEQLLLSNWPERVDVDQTLFTAPLPAGPARIMLHHRNLPEQPARWLDVRIQQGAEPQRYAVISHIVGPSTDEIFAGHLAATRYLDALTGPAASGWMQDVAGGQTHLLEHRLMKPGQTVSGMLLVTPVGTGKPGTITVVARTADNLEEPGLQPIDPGARTARGVFPAVQTKTLDYQLGTAYLYEDLGAAPYVASLQAGLPNAGNFGVVFRYQCKFRNDAAEDREVRLALSARGGPARGTFFVDGERLETGLLAAEPRLVKRWLVPARAVLEATVETFPQAGSNYPVHLVFSTADASSGGAGPTPRGTSGRQWMIP